MEVAEVAVVIDSDGQPIYWHLPPGRSATAIPDSRALWLVLWQNRQRLAGVAHTHPAGVLRPSATDLVTFAACEDGLGRRLSWWIVTPGESVLCCHDGGEPGGYVCRPDTGQHGWLAELRRRSWPPRNHVEPAIGRVATGREPTDKGEEECEKPV